MKFFTWNSAGWAGLCTALLLYGSGCGREPVPPSSGAAPAAATPAAPAPSSRLSTPFTIVSGSENQDLEPLLREFAAARGVTLVTKYKGSVDIMLDLAAGPAMEADAVWPANALWLTLGDSRKVLKHVESIMQSPVVFGVKRSVAEKLGWIGRPVTVADILAAARAGKFRFAMTSATQSNSGAAGYLGFLHALAGSPDVLTLEHLGDQAVQEKVRDLLSHVHRSSGSSGWLKDLFLARYDALDGMVNYESMIIDANRALVQAGREPLHVVYTEDGIAVADSPLAYVQKGDAAKEEFFRALVEFLKSDATQLRILASGRRTGLGGTDAAGADRTVFNPAWGIDLKRVISPVPMPAEPVIRTALELYQEGGLRKPSLTAYVLDFSGSMKGAGDQQLKEAMSMLLDPVQSRQYLIQASPRDTQIVIPFDSRTRASFDATGNDARTLATLRDRILAQQPGGGTDIYAGSAEAMRLLRQRPEFASSFPAIILMTDGRSQGSVQTLAAELAPERDIPIFSITFGDADPSQLKVLAEMTGGRVFNGQKDLRSAFRSAKGYN